MEWTGLPDAVLERALLAAVSSPRDVLAFQVIERRTRHLAESSAWTAMAARAHLGAGICASLGCNRLSQKEVDWREALLGAARGHLRCSSVADSVGQHGPSNLSTDQAAAERSGHVCVILHGTVLFVFGGVRRQTPDQEHPAAVAEPLAIDLSSACWLAVQDDGMSLGTPGPRVRPTLTAHGASSAILVGGQTFEGPGTGTPYDEIWNLQCEYPDKEAGVIRCHWHTLEPCGCSFEARACHTAVNTPCGLLVFGGVGQYGRVLCCEAYCLNEGKWTMPAQSGLLPREGALHHGCYLRRHVVLVGGVADAGLQRRGLGRATDIHVLSLDTWVWSRLPRHDLTPPVHVRAAPLVLGNRLFLVGGDSGGPSAQSDYVAVLDLDSTISRDDETGAQPVWARGAVAGLPFTAAGHSIEGGILLGGLNRTDDQAPIAFLLPDAQNLQVPAAKARAKVPRWFKK